MWSGGKAGDNFKCLPITIKQYAKNDMQLKEAQEYAKNNKLGLWKQANPLAPWDYRQGKTTTTVSNTSLKQADSSQKIENVVYVTRTGKKYHRSSCRYAANAVKSMPRSEAEALGYEACKVCNP